MKEEREGHRDTEETMDENDYHSDGVDLPDILIRTVTDLQAAKDKLEEGLTVYNNYFDSILHTSDELRTAKQLVNVGIQIQVSLLNFIKTTCQIVGIVSSSGDVPGFIEVKSEPDLAYAVKAEIEDEDMDASGTQLHIDTGQSAEENSEEKSYGCSLCGKSYKTNSLLKVHMKGQHTEAANRRDFSCELCDKAFKKSGHLKEHMIWRHSDKTPFKCDICSKNFKTKSSMNLHLKQVHVVSPTGIKRKKELNSQKVTNASDEFDEKQILLNMEKEDDSKDIDPDSRTKLDISSVKSVEGDDLSSIKRDLDDKLSLPEIKDDCQNETASLKSEDNPIDSVTNFDPEVRKLKSFKKKKRPKKEKKTFSCEVCGKVFPSNCRLVDHVVVHTDSRPFKCHICEKTFRYKTNLTGHIADIHKCKTCDQQFQTSEEKRKHMIAEHPEQLEIPENKKIICDICGFATGSKAVLTRHMLVHTGEKPFTCTICAQGFTCNYSLKHHMYLHTGEMPFECDACGRRFRRKGQLMTHYRLHTGEKPFECNICGKAFHLGGERNKHVKKAHGGSQLPPCKMEL